MPIGFSSKDSYIAVITPDTWSNATATSTDPTVRVGNIGLSKLDGQNFWTTFYGYDNDNTAYSINWIAIGK